MTTDCIEPAHAQHRLYICTRILKDKSLCVEILAHIYATAEISNLEDILQPCFELILCLANEFIEEMEGEEEQLASLAASVALAGTTATSSPLATQVAHQDEKCNSDYENEEEYALNIHDRIRLKRKETNQATLHWKTTTSKAQRPPSSRRTVAMAATQGV